jgi:hypothetical protein
LSLKIALYCILKCLVSFKNTNNFILTLKGERFSSRSSFYNFESEPSSYNRFDVTPCYNSDDVIHFDLVFPYKGFYYRNLFEFFKKIIISSCYITDIFTIEELANQRYLDRAIYSAISLMTKQALIRFAFPRVELIFF